MGNKLLLKVSQPVLPHEFGSEWLKELITDLHDTMLYHDGVGIAAPQIGVSKQVFIIEYDPSNPRYENIGGRSLTVVINPVITPVGDEMSTRAEGCLSVPGLRGEVTRNVSVKYEYFDFDGRKVVGEDSGFFARVLQHESDHLQGVLFPMRITDFSTFAFIEEAKKI